MDTACLGPSPHPKPRGRLLVAHAVLLLLGPACQRDTPQPPGLAEDVIAEIGPQRITFARFREEWDRRCASSPGSYATVANARALLEEMVRFEVLLQRAQAAGYDHDPRIVASVRRLMVARFQEDELKRRLPATAQPEEQLAYYREHPAQFGTPEARRGAVIFVKVPRTASEAQRSALRARIESIRSAALAQAGVDRFFGALAQEHSDDQASRYAGGDTGWMKLQESSARWEAPILPALFALGQPGELSPILTTGHGHYVVKLVEVKPARLKPFAEVASGVEYLLAQERQQQAQAQFYQEQSAGMAVRINASLLESCGLEQLAEGRPPKLPEN